LSSVENASLPLLLDGSNSAKTKQKAIEWLTKSDSVNGRQSPRSIVAGQQQRVAIARALIADPCSCSRRTDRQPRHQIVDEIAGLLKQVAKEWGRAVLMVTHDPRIAAYADRIVFLKDGKIVSETQLDPSARTMRNRFRNDEGNRVAVNLRCPMNFQLTLAARYLAGRKLRTFLTTLAIVIAVMVISAWAFTCHRLQTPLKKRLSASGQNRCDDYAQDRRSFSASTLNKVKAIDGIAVIAGSLERVFKHLPPNFYGKNSTVNVLTLVASIDDCAGSARLSSCPGPLLEKGRWNVA